MEKGGIAVADVSLNGWRRDRRRSSPLDILSFTTFPPNGT